jgi:hypothetical protein
MWVCHVMNHDVAQPPKLCHFQKKKKYLCVFSQT